MPQSILVRKCTCRSIMSALTAANVLPVPAITRALPSSKSSQACAASVCLAQPSETPHIMQEHSLAPARPSLQPHRAALTDVCDVQASEEDGRSDNPFPSETGGCIAA